MTPAVEKDETAYPRHVLLFSTVTVVTQAYRLEDLIQQAWFTEHAV
jgi:hypothetical protein